MRICKDLKKLLNETPLKITKRLCIYIRIAQAYLIPGVAKKSKKF